MQIKKEHPTKLSYLKIYFISSIEIFKIGDTWIVQEISTAIQQDCEYCNKSIKISDNAKFDTLNNI